MPVLLDSVILIDHLNGIAAATRYLRTLDGAHISVITRAEVLAGVDPTGLGAVERLVGRYATLGIDRLIADLAAKLRREHRWKLPDAFQAAIAQSNGLKLATRNTKDFPAALSFVVVPYVLK